MILLQSAVLWNSRRVKLTWYHSSPLNDLHSVCVTTQYRINHSWGIISWISMVPHVESALGQIKLNPAETDQRTVVSRRWILSRCRRRPRRCPDLDPVVIISSWITGLKKEISTVTPLMRHSFIERRWFYAWIGFSHQLLILLVSDRRCQLDISVTKLIINIRINYF